MNNTPEKTPVKLLDDVMDVDQSSPPQDKALSSTDKPGSFQSKPAQTARGGSKTVFLYLAILFAAAFAMLLLAYFVQQRNNEAAIGNLQSIGNLIDDNQVLRNRLNELEGEFGKAEEEIERLVQENGSQQEQLKDARQRESILTLYAMLEQQIRQENYDAASATLQSLSQFGSALDFGLSNLDPDNYFDLVNRLQEIALALGQLGYTQSSDALLGITQSSGTSSED